MVIKAGADRLWRREGRKDEEEEAVTGRKRKELVTTCSQHGVQSEQRRFLSSLQGDE